MILLTKLHKPHLAANIVHRTQLFTILDDSLQYALTLVSAPAGFGKSTLLSDWLAQRDIRSAWLSLDASDNDLAVFLSYIISAVRNVHVGACAETEAMIRLASLPDIDVLAHQLINELETLPDDFILVLDDFHAIHDSAIHQLVATIVRRPPRPLHLIMATRQDPDLPMVRLRAQGKMLELRSADLRFRRNETLAFLSQIPDLEIDEEGVAILDEVVEGWPAGLRLAALSLRFSHDSVQTLAALAGSHTQAVDYLFHEILTHLSGDQRSYLLRISITERFCKDLCETVCSLPDDARTWPDGLQFIQWLQATNLFVVPLDNEGEWFRFHHLFLQLLRDQLHLLYDKAALTELQRKAAAWFVSAGMIEDALHHYLSAGDLDMAVIVVNQARRQAINNEDWSRMARWLNLFPADYIKRTPELWIIQAWSLQSRFRLNEVDLILDQIETHWDQLRADLSAAEAELLSAEIAILRSQNLFWVANGAQSLAQAKYALAHAPVDYTGVHGNALLYLGIAMQMTGEQEKGFSRLTQDFVHDETRRNPAFSARMLVVQTFMYWVAADLRSAERYARRLLEIGRDQHLPTSRGWGHLYLGCVHYWRNELTEAVDHFAALVEHPFGAHSLAVIHGHCGLIMALLGQGLTSDANEVLEGLFAYAAKTGSTVHLQHVQAMDANLARLQGRTAEATAWADQNANTHPQMPMFFIEIPALTSIRIRIGQGTMSSLTEAATELADVRRFVAETHNTIRLIDVLALDALLHAANGECSTAHSHLRQAIDLASSGGIVRPFVDLGPDMAALLHEVAKDGSGANYAMRLLAAFPHKGVQGTASASLMHPPPGSMVEPLTDRELDVLALLGQRLSDKEIAKILVIAPVTVKTHMRHLFGKLQVNSRREAVARAHSLGLLQPG